MLRELNQEGWLMCKVMATMVLVVRKEAPKVREAQTAAAAAAAVVPVLERVEEVVTPTLRELVVVAVLMVRGVLEVAMLEETVQAVIQIFIVCLLILPTQGCPEVKVEAAAAAAATLGIVFPLQARPATEAQVLTYLLQIWATEQEEVPQMVQLGLNEMGVLVVLEATVVEQQGFV